MVRVPGRAAFGAAARLPARPVPPPRRAVLRRFADPVTGETIDEGLVLCFAGPASYTGEDVAELHVHGGRAVLDSLVAVLAGALALRPAEPGEFTRRAFLNGRLDLTRAEAVADLVDAETAGQRRSALRQLDGAQGRLYEGWRDRLVQALALAEATIDFVDEADVDAGVLDEARATIAAVAAGIAAHLADGGRGERLRAGVQVAILGPPNAGKSTLLNALAGRDVAIVSEVAGTTRDVVEVHVDLDGVAVTLADTAGLRESGDPVEREGVRRALARAAAADLRIVVADARDPAGPDAGLAGCDPSRTLLVANKVDLTGGTLPAGFAGCGVPVVPAAMRDGDGLDGLLAWLRGQVADLAGIGDAVPLTRARHRQALEACAAALERAGAAGVPETFAEDLRLATRCIGRITGRVGVEDVLDAVFASFCIGK